MTVIDNETDPEGWQYAFSFAKKFSPIHTSLDYVRRKKIQRVCKYVSRQVTFFQFLRVFQPTAVRQPYLLPQSQYYT